MTKLTPSLKRTLAFIQQYFAEHDGSPMLDEIAQGLHIQSRGTVSQYIHQLAKLGLIRLVAGQRKIQLINDEEQGAQLQLLGRIAAGRPIEALATPQPLDVLQLVNAHQAADHYALEVKGDSMIEEGIFDGDVIICRAQQTANNGEIAVLLVDDQEATLKRFYKNNDGTVKLVPANSTMQPMIYEADRVKIQGIYKALIRVQR